MLTLLRHLLAILLLPFMMVVVIPYWLLNRFGTVNTYWLARPVGAALILAGLVLFGWCIGLFARIGQGTLAPWDPTHNLVAAGPYRFVRNPMISSVILMLLGQALWWGSWAIGLWAGAFLLINHVYFVYIEEPGLEARFGEPYRHYKANVPRWLPRLKP